MNFVIIITLLFLVLLFYVFNKILEVENFYVPITTWTPYIVDKEYQPGYSNYFYNNGYMYPIY
jgi:hypothetical protein